MSQTEYDFTLPVGYLDGDGTLHRDGTMRLATARDEIEPLRDARVRENSAYLGVLQIARVITRLGNAGQVTPQVIEGLYAVDFDHLQRLYEQVNTMQPAVSEQQLAPAERLAPVPEPPAELAGISDTALRWLLDDDGGAPSAQHSWPEGMPPGLRQEQQRTRSREALMRAGAPPRRGRIDEGSAHGAPAPLLRRRSALPVPEPSSPTGGPVGTSESALLRLSSQPPAETPSRLDAGPAYARVDRPAQSEQPEQPEPHDRAAAMDELCDELIARLRRELLVERERMGAPFGG
jgi:hypothetical protein